MIILSQDEIKEFDIDRWAIRVFLKALELAGGPRKLMAYRNLTWIPSLMIASYAVVLREMANKTEEEIAEFVGSTKQTIRNMLRADENLVLQKLEGELQSKDVKVHTAGGLAKLAYREIKEGRDHIDLIHAIYEQAYDAMGMVWPVQVLKRIEGADFPIDKQEALNRLRGLNVKGTSVEKLLEHIQFPIPSPANLLKQLREAWEKLSGQTMVEE